MNMEQAIYELNNHKKYTRYILLHKEVDDIIKLLKRGEKFEAIYEELIEEYGEYVIRMNYENKPLCVRMDRIKHKYFPKGGINDTIPK